MQIHSWCFLFSLEHEGGDDQVNNAAGIALQHTAESLCQKSEKSRKSEGETPPFFAIFGFEWVIFV